MSAEKRFDVAVADLVRKGREAGHSIPCKRGCSNCCYDVAIVSHLEMRPIVERLQRMNSEELYTVARGVEDWFSRARAEGVETFSSEPDIKAYFRAKLACPLLNQATNECRVYDDRPVACRGHYVVDEAPEACASRAFRPAILLLDVSEPLVRYFHETLCPDGEPPNHLITGMLPAMLANIFRTLLRYPAKTIDEWISEMEKQHPIPERGEASER